MNIQTIKTKIENLKTQQSDLVFSIEATQAKVRTINDQIEILEEVIGTVTNLRRASRTVKRRKPKLKKINGSPSRTGRNNAATFEILSAATHPMTGEDVRKVWPADLKPQSVYPTLNDLTKRLKLDRTKIVTPKSTGGSKVRYAYTIRGRSFIRGRIKAEQNDATTP